MDIELKFRCHECQPGTVVQLSAFFRERRQGEEIKAYMDAAMLKCQAVHLLGSPRCRAGKLDLMLPMSQKGIGFAGPPLTPEDMQDLRRQLKEKPRG